MNLWVCDSCKFGVSDSQPDVLELFSTQVGAQRVHHCGSIMTCLDYNELTFQETVERFIASTWPKDNN
jgi:hypothetical protein